jgi:hypothetical protein
VIDMNKLEIDLWRHGQSEAEKVIRRERTLSLLRVTRRESLVEFLRLQMNISRARNSRSASRLLEAMREVLDRRAKRIN